MEIRTIAKFNRLYVEALRYYNLYNTMVIEDFHIRYKLHKEWIGDFKNIEKRVVGINRELFRKNIKNYPKTGYYDNLELELKFIHKSFPYLEPFHIFQREVERKKPKLMKSKLTKDVFKSINTYIEIIRIEKNKKEIQK